MAQSFITAIARTALSGGTMIYLPPAGTLGQNTDETRARFLAPCDGILSELWTKATANTVGASTLTVRVNGLDTSLSVTIPAGSTGLHSNLVNQVPVSAGDWISIRLSLGAGTSITDPRYSLGFTPSEANQSIIPGMANITVANSNRYHALTGILTASAVESAVQAIMPTDGEMGQLHARALLNSASGPLDVVLRQNEVDTAAALQIPAGNTGLQSDTTLVSVTAGERLGNRFFIAGSGSITALGLSLVFVPNIGRESVLLSEAASAFLFGRTSYFFPTGPSIVYSSEVQTQAIIPVAGELKKLYVQPEQNTLDGSCQVILSKNGVETELTTTVSAGSTAVASDTTHVVSVDPGDLISLKFIVGGTSGSLTNVRVGMVFEPPESALQLTGTVPGLSEISGTLDVKEESRLAGTLGAVSTASASLHQRVSLAGFVDAVGAAEASLASIVQVLSFASGASATLGVLHKRVQVDGKVAVISSSQGSADQSRALSGLCDAHGAAHGSLQRTASLYGIASASSTASARPVKTVRALAHASGTSSTQGTLKKQVGLAGSSAAVASSAASAARNASVRGSVATHSSASASFEKDTTLRTRTVAMSAAEGSLAVQLVLDGSSAAASATGARLTRHCFISSRMETKSSAQADLSVGLSLAGAIAAQTDTATATQRYASLMGLSSGKGGTSAAASIVRRLASQVSGQSSVDVHLHLTAALAGRVDAAVGNDGNLVVQKPQVVEMAGLSTSLALVSGDLLHRRALPGRVAGQSHTAARLVTQAKLGGTSSSESQLTGRLQRSLQLHAATQANSSTRGILGHRIPVTGGADAQSGAQAHWQRMRRLAAAVESQSEATSDISRRFTLAGLVSSDSEAYGQVRLDLALQATIAGQAKLDALLVLTIPLRVQVMVQTAGDGRLVSVAHAAISITELVGDVVWDVALVGEAAPDVDLVGDVV